MNVMTEDEAKGKWCPFARVSEIGERGGAYTHAPNRNLSEPLEAASWCIAGACMAWRWDASLPGPEWRNSKETPAEAEWERCDPDADIWVRWPKHPPVGYCGLAGRPTP